MTASAISLRTLAAACWLAEASGRQCLLARLGLDHLLGVSRLIALDRLLAVLQPPPRFQRASNRPRLRRRAARRMRCGTVEHLAHGSERCIEQVVAQRFEPALRHLCIFSHAILGERVMSKQEAPHRTLVIAAVALPYTTEILRTKIAMRRREAAQAIRGEQAAGTRTQYA